MTYLQQYTKIIKMPTLKTYFSQIMSDLYILNWKSSYDIMLFMRQSRQQYFMEF
jgi:hypothetical protein